MSVIVSDYQKVYSYCHSVEYELNDKWFSLYSFHSNEYILNVYSEVK